jgi:hypothetical protein
MLDYDVARYGCPMHQSFRVPFRPTLDLYDGDEWVQTIEADFVVWEVNLRSDFSYNASVSMVSRLIDLTFQIQIPRIHLLPFFPISGPLPFSPAQMARRNQQKFDRSFRSMDADCKLFFFFFVSFWRPI